MANVQLTIVEQMFDDCEMEIEHLLIQKEMLNEKIKSANEKLNLLQNLKNELEF
jgi:hypothetical protein